MAKPLKPSKRPKILNLSKAERARRVAENMAKGMPGEKAMVAAGYSETYARAWGYKVVKRQGVQSVWTDALERRMKARNLEMDSIVDPLLDGLTATVVARTKYGAEKTTIPDLPVRMEAASRIIELHGGVPKEAEMPPPPQRGMTVQIINDGAGTVEVKQTTQINVAKIESETIVDKPVGPKIRFEKG